MREPFSVKAAAGNDLLKSGGRCITTSLQNPKTGARRATLKKGAEVPVSGLHRHWYVMHHPGGDITWGW
jgi:hypothetical protein